MQYSYAANGSWISNERDLMVKKIQKLNLGLIIFNLELKTFVSFSNVFLHLIKIFHFQQCSSLELLGSIFIILDQKVKIRLKFNPCRFKHKKIHPQKSR